MTHTTPTNPRPRRFRRWVIAWAALMVPCVALHVLAWMTAGAAQPETIAGSWVIKQAANFVHVLTAPGWLLLNAITYVWGYNSLPLTLLAMGTGLAIDLYALSALLRLRRLLLRRRGKVPEPGTGPDLSRRRLIVDAALGAAGVVTAGGLAEGIASEPWDLTIRRYTVPIADLPASMTGYRIVQISDTHLGPRIPREYIRYAVEVALALKPDLFALTGDYIHAGLRHIDPAADLFIPLAAPSSPAPVLGTLGNHDWYNSGKLMRIALQRAGVRTIDNSRLFVDAATREIVVEPPAGGLCIGGLGDLLEDSIDVETALQGVPPGMPRIVLAHNPDTAEEKAVKRDRAPRIDLMLSGHTHGGQIRIPGLGTPFLPSRFGQKYAGGLCQAPRFPVLVSRGVGMSIFPIRLGVPPELVEITLTRA